MQYKTCEKCGSNLDHGERCDCDSAPERPKADQADRHDSKEEMQNAS